MAMGERKVESCVDMPAKTRTTKKSELHSSDWVARCAIHPLSARAPLILSLGMGDFVYASKSKTEQSLLVPASSRRTKKSSA